MAMAPVKLQGMWRKRKNKQNVKFVSTSGFEPRTDNFEIKSQTLSLEKLIKIISIPDEKLFSLTTAGCIAAYS